MGGGVQERVENSPCEGEGAEALNLREKKLESGIYSFSDEVRFPQFGSGNSHIILYFRKRFNIRIVFSIEFRY